MLYREILAVCSQIHTKHIKTQSVPRSKHTPSVIKTSQLMLYREIIAVCSQIHTKHINTLYGHNVELLNPNYRHIQQPLQFRAVRYMLRFFTTSNLFPKAASIFKKKFST
jgi:hypothetical protein